MRQSRILWRVYLYFLLATLAALAVTTGYAVRSLREFHEEQVTGNLEVRAQLVSRYLVGMSDQGFAGSDSLCKELGRLTDMSITVVLPDGEVVGDSRGDPGRMDNHGQLPEIMAALRGETGEAARFSDAAKRTLKYVAVPLIDGGTVAAVVRVSQPLGELEWSRRVIYRQILFGGISVAVLFAVLALYLSRRITQPLEEMRRIAERISDGHLEARIAVSSTDEVGALAQTLNHMAGQLSDRMNTIARQQVEQQAMLTCMVEGVLAVDPEGYIMYLNDAAANLLDVDPEEVRERSFEEIVRHHELQGFISATLQNPESSEAEVVMQGVNERHVQLHGATLSDPTGEKIGGLIVMNDITRQKRLETVRSDFVANVSHELKTPITALKGCVETLTGGIPVDPEAEAKFMAIISRHVNRLETIVQDLLSLSRLEFDVGHGQVRREPASVSDIIRRAVQTLEKTASSKGISIRVDCPDGTVVRANSALLEQAVGNLIDNAIKYSSEGTSVAVSVKKEIGRVVIEVADQGPGIERKHLPRIFERFYRVDRARSRALGGTGLGLSIVKHIALAHQGSVHAESVLGEGSVFTIRLPE